MKRKLCQIGLICFLSCTAHGEDFYGAYGLYPQGSTRIMAMGGAFVALANDMTGSIYNSAGLAMTDVWGDLGGNANIVVNKEVDLNNDGVKDGLPYYYANYAGATHIGNWVIGVGLSAPYAVDLEFDTDNAQSPGVGYVDKRHLNLGITSVDLPIAYKINNNWAVGIIGHTENVVEQYRKTSTNPATPAFDLKAQDRANTTSIGVIYRPTKEWGLGYSHTPGRHYNIDTALNAQGDGFQWFKNVKVPAKTMFGAFCEFHPDWIGLLDVDYIDPISDAVYVGSELMPGFNRAEIDPAGKTIVHGGVEWHTVDKHLWDLFLRFGSYYEPARIKNTQGRQHYSFGFEVRFWALTFGVATDQAPDFVNFSGGFGISFRPF